MAVKFTPDQQATIDARGSSILVSAAAGSGKTAVLVERIIQMVSDERHPVDIDRLLVVTFTNAAAAQMRERIIRALSRKVEENPGNAHLLKQLTLIHNAQITTIDSFCLYIIRNHFDEIDLDPDFRVADDGEIKLLQQDVLGAMLEEYFAAGEEEFLSCVEYFAPTGKDKRLEEQILGLYEFAMSYPWPGEWLAGHRSDYTVSQDSLDECSWVLLLKDYIRAMLTETKELLTMIRRLCEEPDGPYMYLDTLEADEVLINGLLEAETMEEMYEAFSGLTFGRISSKKDESVSPEKRERAKQMRGGVKDLLAGLAKKYFYAPPRAQAERMAQCAPFVSRLLALTDDFRIRLDAKKREKNLMDFHDMEHMALQILTRKTEEGVLPSATALEMRKMYEEIMIDEYQDSNLVQEYLLRSISGEEEEKYNRFMVGDVKQSIYKFRLARPELFMEKFDSYRKEGRERRIDLRQNFRSRRQVTDSVNACFACIMGRDLGGVEYDGDAALYPGASFPEPEGQEDGDPYETEVLLAAAGDDGLEDREREALAIAGKIRQLTGTLQVTDSETGQLRPARYGDIVILLRSSANWDETFKKVLEECGIPVYITSKTGYFAATEVQTILNFLKVLNNPLQDIPLFGVLKSQAAGFSDEDIACMKAEMGAEGRRLYTCLTAYSKEGARQELKEKSLLFLQRINRFRRYVAYMPIHQLIEEFLEETGYLYTVSALPGGEQRRANVEMLLTRAENFEKTSYFGLFHFIRYMEQVEKYNIDYGEANVQDENADTVRIMSIHKSKGLEFPICFVAGLSKKFNMQDTMKPVIMDMDYGIALDYVDTESRIKGSTLKKAVLSGKLRRDSLGEELRVLYVAMTRPQEKLILTGSCKDAEKVQRILDEGGSGSVIAADSSAPGGKRLAFTLRSEASGYLDWLLPAWAVCGQKVQLITASDLLQDQMGEGEGRERLKSRLLSFEKEAGLLSPEEENEEIRLLRERMESGYPHENLQNLYTKTTVSELKKAGMEESAEEAYHLFEEKEVVPYIPRFIRKEEKVSGTARGSAYHKALELFPFAEFTGKTGIGRPDRTQLKSQVKEILDRMAEEGTLLKEFHAAISPEKIALFLESPLAARMAQAAACGRLGREQPFVLGLPAKTLDSRFPEEETVLIQGIIDVWLEEDDGLVVADYKTDSVTRQEELVNRYQVQLDYYARALEQLTGKKVKEKIIYSFALAAEVLVG